MTKHVRFPSHRLSQAVTLALAVGSASLLAGCSSQSEAPSSTALNNIEPIQDALHLADWAYTGEQAAWVAAAQVAGKYAVADAKGERIEIRTIQQQLKYSLDRDAIKAVVPDLSLAEENALCGMAFSSSGRFLYLALCGAGEGQDKDAILAFNTNTQSLDLMDRVTLSSQDGGRYGMAFFKGELFVGSDAGLYRYPAGRNAVALGKTLGNRQLIESEPVNGVAVDMVARSVYASTEQGLYRVQGRALTQVSAQQGLTGLSMGRVFGGEGQGGLFALKGEQLLRTELSSLRSGDAIELKPVAQLEGAKSIAATADGRMMLAGEQTRLLYDASDKRLSYEDWMRSELDSYLTAIKSLVVHGGIDGTSTLTGKTGMLNRGIGASEAGPIQWPIADNVGWALYLLMAIDQVAPDPDIEKLVELLIQTHAGLSPDGHGGERTVDGHFVRVYNRDGDPAEGLHSRGYIGSQPQVYVSMKYLPAAYKAAEMYPDNENLQVYKEYLRQLVKRSGDTIRAEQRITWTLDDHGPVDVNNLMANETWIFGDIGAAQDPTVSTDYRTYSYDRDSFKVDNWVVGEPVILASQAAFIINGATLILNHHFDGAGWIDQNTNYYGATMATTDDDGFPYFAAFSAGNHPSCPGERPTRERPCGYYNEGPSDHPHNIIHFPAVLGLGQHGHTAPMVGGYMAYRDGRHQQMNNASGGEDFPMLTRWSMDLPDFVMDGVGIADFWYGGIGLVESISPGTIAKLRGDFFRPYVKEQNGQLLYSNMTPRRVIGIDADGSRTEYGFQMAPFTLPKSHAEYQVIDPEGDWIELEDLVAQLDGKPMRFTNPQFERGLDSWQVQGDAKVIDGIGGKAVELSGDSVISQPLALPMDLNDTRFVVRAQGRLLNAAGDAKGVLRTRWSVDGTLDTLLGEATHSQALTTDNAQDALVLKSHKPAGANYLHLEYVSEQGEFAFENIAVMRRGADSGLANGDFTQGEQHWRLNGPQVVAKPQRATAGDKVLRFNRGAGDTAWQSASREIDVSVDPLGTRYLVRFDASTQGEAFKFEVKAEFFDAEGNRMVERRDIGDILPGHEGERVATLRKRPGYDKMVLTLQMKRTDAESQADASVFVDNVRLDKERVFHASECVENSPTECLPSLHAHKAKMSAAR
ncbi:hypothetical protein [Ferrimonas pelagia]|uniref:Uncharacterized protein n=1 Tax=Ferrimonas pelagia TaxID=1177826 RepID=A0ABP9F7L8_9GAMM